MHRLSLLATFALLTTPGTILAHPGHGTSESSSITHYLLEPVHAVPLVVLAITAGAMGLVVLRRRAVKAAVKARRGNSAGG